MLQSAGKRRGSLIFSRRQGDAYMSWVFRYGLHLDYKLTTMVIFSPRYVIVNRLRQPIHVRRQTCKTIDHTTTKTLKEDILADEMITPETNEGKLFTGLTFQKLLVTRLRNYNYRFYYLPMDGVSLAVLSYLTFLVWLLNYEMILQIQLLWLE